MFWGFFCFVFFKLLVCCLVQFMYMQLACLTQIFENKENVNVYFMSVLLK